MEALRTTHEAAAVHAPTAVPSVTAARVPHSRPTAGTSPGRTKVRMHLLPLVAIAAVAPFLVAVNLVRLLLGRPLTRGLGGVEGTSLLLGPLCTVGLVALLEWPEWDQPVQLSLSLDHQHTALATEHRPVVLVVALLALVGYAMLREYGPGLPPLVAATSYAAVLAGAGLSAAWVVQVAGAPRPDDDLGTWFGVLLVLFPLDFVLYALRLTRATVRGEELGRPLPDGTGAADPWAPPRAPTDGTPPAPPADGARPAPTTVPGPPAGATGARPDGRSPARARVLAWAGTTLADARRTPLVGFVLLWPLTGVAIVLQVLLGQEPDAAVRAFTETADWALSAKTGHPPVPGPDNHYLCTVAAGGHPAVVRPLRAGVRHGRRITVNRQLLVANAFEDLVATRWPRGHRAIREAYDRHGYPLSRRITTQASADAVYLLMKPFEWAFVAVLYTCDRRPEDRIARQYLPGAPGAH